MESKITKIIDEIYDLILSARYKNYVFNRERTPDIPVEMWKKIYPKADEYEYLYQREKEMR